PRLGAAVVAVIDELDKVQPVTGALIPEHEAAYLTANHLWAASSRKVRLSAARNEFVACQILVRGHLTGVEADLTFEGSDGIRANFSRYQAVATNRGPLPDPLVPIELHAKPIDGQTSDSLYCEV